MSTVPGTVRSLQVWLLLAVLQCSLLPGRICTGQDQTQRPLPLPDRADSVPAASRQLLQKLRQTIEQQQRTPVPPAALDQLGSMLKKLQDQLPPDVVPPGLQGMSPQALQESLQQPQTQQKLKDMLQQFQQDGLLPPVPPPGTSPPPAAPPLPAPRLTPESTESLKDFLQQLQQQAQPFQPPQETPSLPAQPSQPENRTPQAAPVAPADSESSAKPETAPAPAGPPPRTLRRRDNLGPTAPTPRSRLQPPRPLPPAAPEVTPEVPSESRTPRLRQPVPLPDTPGMQPPQPGTQPQPGNQPRQLSQPDRDSLTKIGDLLQQESRRPVSPDAGASPPQSSAAPATDSSSRSQQQREQQEQEQQQQRERVAEQLEQQGFGRTLRNLMEEARREADSAEQQRREERRQAEEQREQQLQEQQRQAEQTAPDGTASPEGAPERPSAEMSPQQMINDLMKQIQDERRKRQQNVRPDSGDRGDERPRAVDRQSDSFPRPEPGRGNKGFADRAFERFQDLVRDLDQSNERQSRAVEPDPPQAAQAPPAPAAAPDRPSASAGSATGVLEGINWVPLLTAAGVLVFLLLLLPAARVLQRRLLPGGGLLSTAPLSLQLVRTREDLVRAFDRLALSCSSAVKPWWNHRQVQTELVRRADAAKVTELVQVYEHARYQPEHIPLSELQLASARVLLQECNSKSV